MKEIDFDSIHNLYMGWRNEQDPFMQRKRKEGIKSIVSPYELLMYSAVHSSPFEAFRNIFSLTELFEILETMKRQGDDISVFCKQALLIESTEDIKIVSEFAKKSNLSATKDLSFVFVGSNIFKYGDVKNIGTNFPHVHVNNLSIEQIEEMIKLQRDYKGVPITINIDNIGQLPLEKLANIERRFDVTGIRIMAKDKRNFPHQGEHTPLNLKTYKQVRKVVDDEIISKLYVKENGDKMHVDYQLTVQILDKLANKIEHDYVAAKKPRFSIESRNASSLVGLLTGQSICAGYSEIFRNILSCVNIECTVIVGTALDSNQNEEEHAWNQVKLGNSWFNVDLTFARDKICKGEPSGDLFMPDNIFWGSRRRVTFDKGNVKNGKSLESTVSVGNHLKVYGKNHKQCRGYITPTLTAFSIQTSRSYDENYNRNGKSPDYKGPIPYVGSSIEKMRSDSKFTDGVEH